MFISNRKQEIATRSTVFKNTAMPAIQDCEVTTHLPLDFPRQVIGHWNVAAENLSLYDCVHLQRPAGLRSRLHLFCLSFMSSTWAIRESGKCSFLLARSGRHMRKGRWSLEPIIYDTTQHRCLPLCPEKVPFITLASTCPAACD